MVAGVLAFVIVCLLVWLVLDVLDFASSIRALPQPLRIFADCGGVIIMVMLVVVIGRWLHDVFQRD